jgi:hypothetical protein
LKRRVIRAFMLYPPRYQRGQGNSQAPYNDQLVSEERIDLLDLLVLLYGCYSRVSFLNSLGSCPGCHWHLTPTADRSLQYRLPLLLYHVLKRLLFQFLLHYPSFLLRLDDRGCTSLRN